MVARLIGDKANYTIQNGLQWTQKHVEDELMAKLTFNCFYRVRSILSRAGGWMVGESNNKANISNAELNWAAVELSLAIIVIFEEIWAIVTWLSFVF